MGSKEQILGHLRQRPDTSLPFPDGAPPKAIQRVVPIEESSPAGLLARFMAEAEKAGCVLHDCPTPEAAIEAVLEIVGQETAVSSWDLAHIPLPGLAEALNGAHISLVGRDATVQVGLTGVDAALAATGSVVLASGPGRPRAASLLPPIHVAVVATGQILPDLESWWAVQKASGLAQTRSHSNIVIVTGPSRTADIAMQLVMGMHGPRELHLVLFHHF